MKMIRASFFGCNAALLFTLSYFIFRHEFDLLFFDIPKIVFDGKCIVLL